MPTVYNQAFNPNFSKELDIESIISAPLVAASKANVVMVTGQTRFLLEYCFTKNDNGTYEPVMIQMSMKRGVIDEKKGSSDPGYITQTELIFTVPLLCLVPLNSLVIEKVALDFDMEITSAVGKPAKATNDSGQKITDDQTQLNGRISYDPDQNSGSNTNQNKSQMSSKLKVRIDAGTLPLPKGVLTILELYTKAIHPVPAEEQAGK